VDEGIAQPIVFGEVEEIKNMAKELNLDLSGVQIVDPPKSKYLASISRNCIRCVHARV